MNIIALPEFIYQAAETANVHKIVLNFSINDGEVECESSISPLFDDFSPESGEELQKMVDGWVRNTYLNQKYSGNDCGFDVVYDIETQRVQLSKWELVPQEYEVVDMDMNELD